MPRAKVAVTLEEETLRRLDMLVKKGFFPSRSRAVEAAVGEKLERFDKTRLARELDKLEPAFERALAEEGLSRDVSEWPEY